MITPSVSVVIKPGCVMDNARKGIAPGEVIRRRPDGSLEFLHDDLTREEPLEIRIDENVVATTMRTPGHDEELALGFLVTEGLLDYRDPAMAVSALPHESETDGNVVTVRVAGGKPIRIGASQRLGTITSSCGICGKRNIAEVRAAFPPLSLTPSKRLPIDILLGLPEALRREQGDFNRTGGIHAAGLFNFEGQALTVREDIGRHNAVDKVIGRAFLDGHLPLTESILLVSGRASFEIMQKALAGGILIVASVSAPSTLAMEFARECRQTLVGFLRPPTFNLYSHVERIVLPE